MYKLHLILKYLLKRRIAWVSLIAVMLCTTMVLVVISVMGGWLNMFKSSFRGLSGDIVVRSEGLAGFPYYQEMVKELEKNPDIAAAVPSIETYGLINLREVATLPVKVMGIPIDQISRVNRFPESLFRQHNQIIERLADPKLKPQERTTLERELHEPPSFNLLDVSTVHLDKLPADVKLAQAGPNEDLPPGAIDLPASAPPKMKEDVRGKFWFDAVRHNLDFEGRMDPRVKDLLSSLSADARYQQGVAALFQEANSREFPNYRAQADSKAYGMIVGAGVIGIRRNREGVWQGRQPWKYETPVKLTVLGVQQGAAVDPKDKSERIYFIVDDSRTQVWQYDNNYVYVPIERLQSDLGMSAVMGEDFETHKPIEIPGRVTEIHVRVRDGIDPNDETRLNDVRNHTSLIVNGILRQHGVEQGLGPMVRVNTWQDEQRIWINAVENEKLLTVMLFAIISVVAIFLIFCIFYMIVVEKTRDIGIIKSVGATSTGVAGIFLGYGLVIGIIGAGMGLLLSYGIVHNINGLHTWVGKKLGLVIWNPEVYLFDTIPNTMSSRDILIIIPIAVVSCIAGALLPAIRAARMNPVEALRWE